MVCKKEKGKITLFPSILSFTLHSSGLMLLLGCPHPEYLCNVIKWKAWGLMYYSILNVQVDVCSIITRLDPMWALFCIIKSHMLKCRFILSPGSADHMPQWLRRLLLNR